MSFFFNNSRDVKTTVACPQCQNLLNIKRTCHEAFMYCDRCKQNFPLQEFIPQMDDAMEKFIEGLHSNRI